MRDQPLVYRMIMALNAADIGDPICEQAASICAEIADQYCTELHLSRSVPTLPQPGARPLDPAREERTPR